MGSIYAREALLTTSNEPRTEAFNTQQKRRRESIAPFEGRARLPFKFNAVD